MGKQAKPYLRCEKVDGNLVLTLMAGSPSGHVLKGRETLPAGDKALLAATIKEMLSKARA